MVNESINRRQRILALLKQRDTIPVSDLRSDLGVSEATIRRDLDKLVSMGQIQRRHGSATFIRNNDAPEPPVILRSSEHIEEKQRIGRTAAALIQEGESIFIGSGTTTQEVARNLCGRGNLTVITNAQTITALLAKEENITLISTGGLLRHSEQSFLGYITVQALSQLRPQKVIIGIHSISLTEGLTSNYLPEVTTDRAIIESGRELILVADHTKFGKVSPAFVAPIQAVTTLITDDQTPAETVAELQAMGIGVIVC